MRHHSTDAADVNRQAIHLHIARNDTHVADELPVTPHQHAPLNRSPHDIALLNAQLGESLRIQLHQVPVLMIL